MAAEAETRTEREARWWAAWFDADYSWEGLAEHAIDGGGLHGETTLQDYWRRDPETGRRRTDAALERAGELVEFDGRWWHLAHLPLRDRYGVDTSWKAGADHPEWARLDALVATRLLAGEATAGPLTYRGFRPSGLDGRVRLDGAVVRLIVPPGSSDVGASPLHLSCRRARIVSADLGQALLGNGADFTGATFSDSARFDSVTFSGDASFDNVTFSRGTSFTKVTFLGSASFDSATFPTSVGFFGATFSGDAAFGSATFSGDVGFYTATFSSGTSFSGATFSGSASFGSVMFFGYAIFDSANFSGRANFDSATFSSDAHFHQASFSGATNFVGAIFSGDARFYGTIFSGEAYFYSAVFEKRWLVSGRFRRTAKLICEGCVFKGPVTFAAKAEAPETSFRRAFYAARFLDIADFSGAVGQDDAGRMACAFVETQFEKALVLTDGSERHAREGFREWVEPTIARSRRHRRLRAVRRNLERKRAGRRYISPWRYRIDRVRLYFLNRIRVLFFPRENPDLDARLRDLEAGCRTVKIAMGRARDELREQRYYRFQLKARLARSDIDVWEKTFGFVYRVTSDFGSSLIRPLAGIMAATALFGYAYAVWGGSLAAGGWRPLPSRDHLFEGQGVALAALKPFSTVEAPRPEPKEEGRPSKKQALHPPPRKVEPPEPPKPPSVVTVLTANSAVTLGLRVVTAVQVIVSTLLLFLFGLAVKRRFQIS